MTKTKSTQTFCYLLCSLALFIFAPGRGQVIDRCHAVDHKERIRDISIEGNNSKLIYTDKFILRVQDCRLLAAFEGELPKNNVGRFFAHVTSVYRSKEHIWVGTLGEGLNIFYRQTRKPIVASHPLQKCLKELKARHVHEIYKVYRQHRAGKPDVVWLLTNKGVFTIKNKQLSYQTDFDELSNRKDKRNRKKKGKPQLRRHIEHHFTEITEYKNDLWIVGEGKLLRRHVYFAHRGLQWQQVKKGNIEQALESAGRVNSMTFDSKGRLWMVGDAIIRYNPLSGEVFESSTETFKNKEASSIKIDHHGKVWVGTDGGGLFNVTDTSKINLHQIVIRNVQKKSPRHIRISMQQNKLLTQKQVKQLKFFIKYKNNKEIPVRLQNRSEHGQTYFTQHHKLIKSFVPVETSKSNKAKFRKGAYTFSIMLGNYEVGSVKGKF